MRLHAPAVLIALLALVLPLHAQETAPLTADVIMARVAANQDRAVEERARFVYVQHARVQSRRGSTIMCEETTDSRVTPSPTGQQQTVLSLDGRARGKHGYITYREEPAAATRRPSAVELDDEKKPPDPEKSGDVVILKDTSRNGAEVALPDTDVDLVENMRDNLLRKPKKDGISENLFPLGSAQQKEMTFRLVNREPKNGRDTFHIAFAPKDKSDFGWKGDAWIDAAAFQPVVVRTAMAENIPLAIRLMLGTSVPGLGFTAIYAPQPVPGGADVWFPASFGTEFKVNVLFFFHRQIVLSAENRQFERTHVSATIHDDVSAMQPDQQE